MTADLTTKRNKIDANGAKIIGVQNSSDEKKNIEIVSIFFVALVMKRLSHNVCRFFPAASCDRTDISISEHELVRFKLLVCCNSVVLCGFHDVYSFIIFHDKPSGRQPRPECLQTTKIVTKKKKLDCFQSRFMMLVSFYHIIQ